MATETLQTLCKWRNIYSMMATMGTEPAFQRYVRDVADKHLIMRAEITALTALLIQKGIFTALEFTAQLDVEAEHLCGLMEASYPGFRASASGLEMSMPECKATMESWNRPVGMGGE